MSKLDEIVSYNENVPSERIKEEIKALFLELIGEDEVDYGNYDSWAAMKPNSPMRKRDELRAELRTKVDSL